MKQFALLIACLALTNTVLAQKDSLAVDEHGKYIYYKVIEQDKFDTDTLYARAQHFFKYVYPKTELKLTRADANAHTLAGAGLFTVSDKGSISKHDDGQVTYTLNLEIKDKKYRYWLTNFIFTPYYRDRYNNYVPQPGMDMPIEQAGNKLDAKQLSMYLNQTAAFTLRLSTKLKWYMQHQNVVKIDTTKRVIIINKW